MTVLIGRHSPVAPRRGQSKQSRATSVPEWPCWCKNVSMTCIIALRQEGIVHMGADDAITGDVVHYNGSKIVRFPSGLLAGFAGSLATQNIMARPESKLGGMTDLNDDVQVNAVFDALQGVAHFQVKGAHDTAFWAQLVLAMGSSIVWMGNVGGWYRLRDEFRCIGEGALVATGAMFVLEGVTPPERIARSIEAASRCVPGVGKMSSYETTAPKLSATAP